MVFQIIRRATHIKRIHKLLLRYGRLTAFMRVLPDFMIIGSQKCGTTSLYYHLKQHPNIAYTLVKEVSFFDDKFANGFEWYRSHFPTNAYRYLYRMIHNCNILVGEATAGYLFDPHAPGRVSHLLPNAKLIVMLRNPIDRAYSQYQVNVRNSCEPLSFEDAIAGEEGRIGGEREQLLKDEHYDAAGYRRFSYQSRGIYVDQLKVWMELFPKRHFLILRSEDYFAAPHLVCNQVARFLDLPEWELKEFAIKNKGSYDRMTAATRERLARFFAPHNQRLYEYLGRDFQWD